MKPLLIVGCGRSGTRYAKEVLAAVGIDVGHEVAGPMGTVDWHKVPDPSEYKLVLHQVRHPLRVIESTHTIMGRSWDFLSENEPRITRNDPILVRSMKCWLYWNERAEKVSSKTYMVEEMEKHVTSICNELGVKMTPQKLGAVRRISKQNHTRRANPKHKAKYPTLTWVDLEDADSYVAGEIMTTARRYGYRI